MLSKNLYSPAGGGRQTSTQGELSVQYDQCHKWGNRESYRNTQEGCLTKTLRIRRGLPKEMISKIKPKGLTAVNQRRDGEVKQKQDMVSVTQGDERQYDLFEGLKGIQIAWDRNKKDKEEKLTETR